jgi:hypothetical protein
MQVVLSVAFIYYFDMQSSLSDFYFVLCLLIFCPFTLRKLEAHVTLENGTSLDVAKMRFQGVFAAVVCITSLGSIVTAWMWMGVGNGNANFLFFQTLVLYLSLGLELVEVTRYLVHTL